MRDDAAQEARPAAAARPRPGLARNVASVLATDAASSLAVLCSGIVLARWLSVADRGVYAVLIALQATLVTVFQLGLPSAAIHRIRAAGAPPARVATAGIATVVALSLLVLTLPMLLAPWLREGLLPTAPAGVLLLAVAAVPAQLATAWLGGLARALDRFDLANAARLSVNAGTLLMATVVLVGGGGGLRGLLWALLLLHAGVALALGKRVLRRTGVSRRPDLDEIRAGLGFGALNHGETLSATLHERADVFLLTFLLADPSPVALYAVAVGADHSTLDGFVVQGGRVVEEFVLFQMPSPEADKIKVG